MSEHALRRHWWLDRCFLYVGRITPSKGVPQIVEAWLDLTHRIAACPPLWLVGGELGEIESMRATIGPERLERHEASGALRWWGYLDAAGISTVLLKAYVLVVHSQYEPGGRVVLEAMAQGIPVIATRHGFAAELVRDWHSGFLVDYGDRRTLTRRMEHFALQPLLRHALGSAARRIAAAALRDWDFIGAHLRAYELALQRNRPAGGDVNQRRDDGQEPSRGFEGVYPFEGEAATGEAVTAFAAAVLGQTPDEVTEEKGMSRRSRFWEVRIGERRWIVKAVQHTYAMRPMWDRAFAGAAVESREARIAGEVLGSRCASTAPLLGVDHARGLLLRASVPPADCTGAAVHECIEALVRFHRSGGNEVALRTIRARLDRPWRDVRDDDLDAELVSVDRAFRQGGWPFHAWQPLSLRLGWRYLERGLASTLEVPGDLRRVVDALVRAESAVADADEPVASFGWCHGDMAPAHVRTSEGGEIVLIDCERIHPGFFGHDLARLAFDVMDRAEDATANAAAARVLDAAPPSAGSRRLMSSWMLWGTILELCRAHVLLDANGVGRARRRLRLLRSAGDHDALADPVRRVGEHLGRDTASGEIVEVTREVR